MGRAVAVGEELRTQRRFHLFEGLLRHRIATEAVDAHWRWCDATGGGVLGELFEIGRRETSDGHAVIVQGLIGLLRRPQATVANHQTTAAVQGTQPAFMGTVESERHEVQLATARVHFVQLGDGLAVHAQRSLGHGHAFRPSGGAGGVNQIGQALLVNIADRCGIAVKTAIELIDFQAQHAMRRR